MTFFELMDSKKTAFSKNETLIYKLIRKSPERYAYASLTQACDYLQVNKPSVVRFAQKLGFSGFTQMQYKLQEDLKAIKDQPADLSHAKHYATILKNVEESADLKKIEVLAKRIRKARSVYIFGIHLSSLPAALLNIILMHEDGIVSVNPEFGMIPQSFKKDDVIIIYSAISGGSYTTLMKQLRNYGENKPYMVLVTVNSKHPLRHNFDETVVLPTLPAGDSDETSIVLSDTFAFMMFDDMLMRTLKKIR